MLKVGPSFLMKWNPTQSFISRLGFGAYANLDRQPCVSVTIQHQTFLFLSLFWK